MSHYDGRNILDLQKFRIDVIQYDTVHAHDHCCTSMYMYNVYNVETVDTHNTGKHAALL